MMYRGLKMNDVTMKTMLFPIRLIRWANGYKTYQPGSGIYAKNLME